MATIREDKAISLSTDVAESFVKRFYHALERDRSHIASFYVPLITLPDGKILPSITITGNQIPDPASVQRLLEQQMPKAHYDVQSFDCQVINPNSPFGSHAPASGKNMSILVMVNGNVKLGEAKDSETRAFSETLVLVPNPEAAPQKPNQRSFKDWLIQDQTFRFVV